MKTLTIEQMQLTGGRCDNIWKRLGVIVPSSMSAGLIAGAFALGLATGGVATGVTIGGYVIGAVGGYVICRFAKS